MATVSEKVSEVVDEVVESVEEAITKPETPESKKEKKSPELNEEGEFLIRRISEEVTKGIAALLKPTENEEEDEDPKPRKRRTVQKTTPEKKRSFFPNFFRK